MSGISLDRDGVIIQKAPQGEYITRWAEVELLSDSIEAIASLRGNGFTVVIVKNQRWVATGKIPVANLDEIYSKIRGAVADAGGLVSEIYCCTHDVSESYFCRKPQFGMLLRAAKDFSLKLADCWMVGDSAVDILAGKRAGCKTPHISQTMDLKNLAGRPDVCMQSLHVFAQHPELGRR